MQTRSIYHRLNRFLMASILFTAAYMVTITIGHAQAVTPPSGIQMGENGNVVIQGRILEAKDNYLVVDSAGKEMRIDLKDIELTSGAEVMFKPDMNVTVSGKMNGDNFGVPVVDAKSVTATEAAPAGAMAQ